MPAPLYSRPIEKKLFAKTIEPYANKPTLFSESARPSPITVPSIRHFSWSPTGAAIAQTSGAHIRVWNPEKANVKLSQELRGHTGYVEKVEWNPAKEAELASTGTDGTVKLWDVRTGGAAATSSKGGAVMDVKVGDYGLFMTWKPDGNEIVVVRRDDLIVPIDVRMGVTGNVEFLEPREGKKLQASHCNDICFSNSGRELFATTSDGTVQVLDWPSMQHLYTLNAHTSRALSCAHSPNGSYLAVGGGDALITLWDTYDWVCKRTLANPTSGIHSLSFSFDGTFICGGYGSERDTQPGLEIVHVETGDTVYKLDKSHPGVVAWHPLRYWLAYTGDPGGLKVIGVGSNL